MEKSCPRHPGQETIVPCLGCGRDFCRICDPPKGAGQYCPRCYAESLERLAPPRRKLTTRLKYSFRRGDGKPGRAAGEAGSTGLEPDLRPAAPSPEPGWMRRGRLAIGGAMRSARDRAKAAPGRSWRFCRDRFPLCLEPRGKSGGMPPLRENWLKLVLIVLGGALLWMIPVMIGHVRRLGYSYVAAGLVAAFVVWALGTRFDVQVAVVAAMLAVISLLLGELLVQFLYAVHVVKLNDIVRTAETSSEFYRGYFFYLVVEKLLPSAAIAFLIGLWPLPARIGWRGFGPERGGATSPDID